MSEIESSELPQSPGKKPEREGLPPGYRMRADAHYVDQLATRRATELEAPARPSKRTTDPEPAERVDHSKESRDRRADRVIAQLLQEVEAIAASASLIAPGTAALAQRANIAAVRAHAWRAAWLLRAHTIIDGTHRAQVRPRPLGRVLEQVREGFAAESTLTGLQVEVAGESNALVPVDETALTAGVAAAVFASVALLPDPAGATVRITASTLGAELRAIEVSQDETPVHASTSTVFFDPAWTERPGGAWTASAAACVKAVAALHGGDVVFMPGARRGSTIRFNFTRTAN